MNHSTGISKGRKFVFQIIRYSLIVFFILIWVFMFSEMINIDIHKILKTEEFKIQDDSGNSAVNFIELLLCSACLILLLVFRYIYPFIQNIAKIKIHNTEIHLSKIQSEIDEKKKENKILHCIYKYFDKDWTSGDRRKYIKYLEKELVSIKKKAVDELFSIVGNHRDHLFFQMINADTEPERVEIRKEISLIIPVLENVVEYYRIRNCNYELHISLAVLAYVYKDSMIHDDLEKEKSYKLAYDLINESIQIRRKHNFRKIINYEINRLLLAINISDPAYHGKRDEDYDSIVNHPFGESNLLNCHELVAPNLRSWYENKKKERNLMTT